MMFGYIVFTLVAGVIVGAAIASWLNRATAAPPATPSVMPSALGVDIAGNNGGYIDPYFARLLKESGLEL
jgi:hypothetical protein